MASSAKKLHKLLDENRILIEAYLFDGNVLGGKPLVVLLEEFRMNGSNPALHQLITHMQRCVEALNFLEGVLIARARAVPHWDNRRHDAVYRRLEQKRRERMASGIKTSGNRPKTAKHLRGTTEKKFKNEDPEAKAKYQQKIAARAARKRKK